MEFPNSFQFCNLKIWWKFSNVLSPFTQLSVKKLKFPILPNFHVSRVWCIFPIFSIFFWICNEKWNSCNVPKFGFPRCWLIFQLSFIFNFGEFVQFYVRFFSWILIKIFSQFYSHFWFQVFVEFSNFISRSSKKVIESYKKSNFWFWKFGENF